MQTPWTDLSYPYLCGLLAERPTKLSQAMHNAGFRALNIPFHFVAFPLRRGGDGQAIAAMRLLGFRGYSVTIPHKERICEHLDELSPEAKEIGAVNTVVNDGSRIYGFNTDLRGILVALEEAGLQVTGARVLILGAGGAARAAVVAVRRGGAAEVVVSNRERVRGETVAREFQLKFLPLGELRGSDLRGFNLLINATPLGSSSLVEISEYPFSLTQLRPGTAIFDMVTAHTPLIREGRKAGFTVISGLRMLLFQALEQFRLFTGQEPPQAAMESALTASLSDKP